MLSCMQIELYAEPDPAPDLQPQVAPASRPGVLLRADRPLTGQPFPEHGRRDEAEGLAAARLPPCPAGTYLFLVQSLLTTTKKKGVKKSPRAVAMIMPVSTAVPRAF